MDNKKKTQIEIGDNLSGVLVVLIIFAAIALVLIFA
jgi:hypothetical protein